MDLTVFVLLSVCSHQFVLEATQPQIICSSEPVQAVYSEHVLLQCYLKPPLNAASETVKWTCGNDVVILCQNGKYNPGAQREHFEARTALSQEALTKGNLSLMLTSLKLTDTGRYKCSFITDNVEKSCYVNLTVGESDVIGSDEPVKANVGEDVILPCHLEPPFNVSTLTVEWRRNKTYVHVYRSMKHDPNQQNSHFINRTYLFCDEIGKGNISLLLRNVSKEDEGLYICYVPKLHSQVRKGNITLKVDAAKHDTKQFNGSINNNSTKNTDGADVTAVIIAVITAVFTAVIIAFIAWYIRKCWQNP
uniref:Ig-like domain-containing protein n=1 Tax=Astatotilapia calliptera TaxID=8154 RepID=A0AAX7VVF1_ASTCA